MRRVLRHIPALLFAAYLFGLLKVTLFRTSVTLFNVVFAEQNGYITSLETAYTRANFIPFYSVYYYLISVQEPIEVGLVNIFGNILLFVPFGFLLPLTFQRFRSLRSTTLLVAFSSIFFEIVQMLLVIGHFDIDDVLLNTVGGITGYAVFFLAMKYYTVRYRSSFEG